MRYPVQGRKYFKYSNFWKKYFAGSDWTEQHFSRQISTEENSCRSPSVLRLQLRMDRPEQGELWWCGLCQWLQVCHQATIRSSWLTDWLTVFSTNIFPAGNRRQLLFVGGKTILAFVTRGSKFADCSSFTEVTSQVDCKVRSVGSCCSASASLYWPTTSRLWLTWRLSVFPLPAQEDHPQQVITVTSLWSL